MGSDVCFGALELAPRIAATFKAALEPGSAACELRACAHALAKFIGADTVLLTEVNLAEPDATLVAVGPTLEQDVELSRELSRTGSSHPAVLSYLTPSDDGLPRRVSDVADSATWRRHLEDANAFQVRGGTHQLSIVSCLTPTRGRGWVLMRDRRDFTDREVTIAAELLPVLSILDRPLAPAAPAPPPVTRRQMQLLRLLAQGASARGMARTLGISERTVNKHLELLYRRLEVRSRGEALAAAARHGITY